MNIFKKTLIATSGLVIASSSFATGLVMVEKVEKAVTENAPFLWTVGGSVIVLSVIGLVIRKIKTQAS